MGDSPNQYLQAPDYPTSLVEKPEDRDRTDPRDVACDRPSMRLAFLHGLRVVNVHLGLHQQGEQSSSCRSEYLLELEDIVEVLYLVFSKLAVMNVHLVTNFL